MTSRDTLVRICGVAVALGILCVWVSFRESPCYGAVTIFPDGHGQAVSCQASEKTARDTITRAAEISNTRKPFNGQTMFEHGIIWIAGVHCARQKGIIVEEESFLAQGYTDRDAVNHANDEAIKPKKDGSPGFKFTQCKTQVVFRAGDKNQPEWRVPLL